MDVNTQNKSPHADIARRVALSVSIGGHDATSALTPSLLSFSYTDNASGKADDIQIELHDREGHWTSDWLPRKGTAITASLLAQDWYGQDMHASLNCGQFTVDEVDFSGPPDKMSLKAVSASLTDGLRETAQTRAWESFSLQGLASEMAAKHGLTLLYDAPEHRFERQDQREESDLAFLSRMAQTRGVHIKVHDGKLALYEAKTADARPGSLTIAKGGQFSPKSYTFREKSQGTAYSACEVNYLAPSTGEVSSFIYDAEGKAVESGNASAHDFAAAAKVITVNQRVESEADARQLAQNTLRSKNGAECTGTLEIMGHPGLVAGVTIQLEGFGTFSGAYFVEKAEHKVSGSGYTTSAEVRKTLAY